jgi:hypothetical protein
MSAMNFCGRKERVMDVSVKVEYRWQRMQYRLHRVECGLKHRDENIFDIVLHILGQNDGSEKVTL